MLADALLRSVRAYTLEDTISNLEPVFKKLFILLDVPIKASYCDIWSGSSFLGYFFSKFFY